MANRHASRSVVLQTLFECDVRSWEQEYADAALARNAQEFGQSGDLAFMEKLLKGVLVKRADIDAIITKAAPEWPLPKISCVDRNVLRLGLYELIFSERDEVPAKVAINEAIELAKRYGGENSGRFVNGVMGSVYKEMGEPGKNEQPKKKIKDVPYEEMPIEELSGALVYGYDGDQLKFVFVHDVFGKWTLPKGHIDSKADINTETNRVVQAEIGLPITPEVLLGKNEYIAADPEKGKIRKQVSYFLAKTDYAPLTLDPESGGLDDIRWFAPSELEGLSFYNDIMNLIAQALGILSK